MDTQEEPAGRPRDALGADLIVPALACLLTGYYLVSTNGLVWEAKATGVAVGVVLLGLCAIQLARIAIALATGAGRAGFGELFVNTPFNRQRFALVALTALFIGTIGWVGTTLGLFLLLIGGMLVLGVRSVSALLGVAFAAAASVYLLLILLLGSKLPRGPVENLLAALGIGS